jgi:hypothetical protein
MYCSYQKIISVLNYKFSQQKEHYDIKSGSLERYEIGLLLIQYNVNVTVRACCPCDRVFNDLNYSLEVQEHAFCRLSKWSVDRNLIQFVFSQMELFIL